MPNYSIQYRINDEVTFFCNPEFNNRTTIPGRVVAIRITEAKISFDILSSYTATIFRQIDSSYVFPVTGVAADPTQPIL